MGIDEYSILKKKPKKNAFAATALLISIAIALLVMVGAVLLIGKINDKDRITPKEETTTETSTKKEDSSTTCEGLVKEIVFNDNLDNIKEAATNYFTNERLPQEVGESEKITLKEMEDKKLVRTVYDASANVCDGKKSYVEVTKLEDEYEMKIYLSCSDIEDYIIVHLGCYDYCDKDVCEKKEEKVYEYEYKKTTSCVMGDWSKWGSWKTTREKTSSLKKEDIKTETSTKQTVEKIDAISNTSYNCDKYGKEYKLVGTSCVKATTITDSVDAKKNPTTYNCNRYGKDYTPVGDKCIKETTKKVIVDGKPNPTTYTCPKGYDKVGSKCKTTVKETSTTGGSYNCPSDYTKSGTKCIKTVAAEDVISTRKVTRKYTCYKEECTRTTEFTCPTDNTCGVYPITSCETVKKTCTRQVDEEYVSGHNCPDKTYVQSQDKDGNYICTKTIDATFTCPKDYNPSNGKCVRTYDKPVEIDGTKDPVTYTCSGDYTQDKQDPSKCYKYEPLRLEEKADKDPVSYTCKDHPGYDLSGSKCVRVLPSEDTEEATKVVKYSCPIGYDKNDKTCTRTTKDPVKVTYYRYATRTCTGGSTSTKWSTSKNDSILKNEGYKLTGKKRLVTDIVK